MSEPERIFTPEPQDGQILSIAAVRGLVMVVCEYALYQMEPCEGPIQWTIQKVSTGRQIIPANIRF